MNRNRFHEVDAILSDGIAMLPSEISSFFRLLSGMETAAHRDEALLALTLLRVTSGAEHRRCEQKVSNNVQMSAHVIEIVC